MCVRVTIPNDAASVPLDDLLESSTRERITKRVRASRAPERRDVWQALGGHRPCPGYEAFTARYGDLHNHCDLSYGRGTPQDALANARLQLDFVRLTVHGAWPDVPTADPDLGYLFDDHRSGFEPARAGGAGYLQLTEAANDPGRFVTLPSFEWHAMAYGDHCVYLRDAAGSRPCPTCTRWGRATSTAPPATFSVAPGGRSPPASVRTTKSPRTCSGPPGSRSTRVGAAATSAGPRRGART